MLRKLPAELICSKRLFYLLSFTWGLLLNGVGAVYALLFLLTLHKPKRYLRCVAFESRFISGGFNVGIFIFTCKRPTASLLSHEHGHALQNCFYGPFMPFLVSAPSFIRYHYRSVKTRLLKKRNVRPYDAVWFESEASELGRILANGAE